MFHVRRAVSWRQFAASGARRNHRCRRLSSNASSAPARDAAAPGDDGGWPLKFKVAGGLIVSTAIPWMASYAVAHDPGTRRLVEMVAPGLVQWLRRRKGGHFEDEDPKRLEYVARAPEWMDVPVDVEVRTNSGGGEARHLLSLDPKTPVSALGKLAQPHLQEEGRGAGGVAWLTDCRAVEAGEDAVSAGEDAAFSRNSQEFSSSWSSSSSSSSSSSTSWSSNSKDNSDSGKGDFPAVSATSDSLQQSPLSREVVACNVRSWWDIAGLEQERARAPPPAQQQSQQPTAGRSVGAKGSRTSYEQQSMTLEKFKASNEAIEQAIRALEMDMRSGARSVDDVQQEVRDLRKQQKELRRNYLPKKKKRFLGLF